MKNLLLSIMMIMIISCSTPHDKYFEILKGNWQIDEFLHGRQDISEEGYFIIGFEKNNYLWFSKLDGTNQFTSSDYKIYKVLDTLKISIKNCDDTRFNGIYDLYIDTIPKSENRYIEQLTFDSKNTYIRVIKGINLK